ncbi:hypothetical protein A2U01_0092813, partial [Trifolium medium]|nr:hypothetical protein [Trifolium medium]
MSKAHVNLTYLQYFCDIEMVDSYDQGIAALTHLYRMLNVATILKTKVVSGYMTLMQ